MLSNPLTKVLRVRGWSEQQLLTLFSHTWHSNLKKSIEIQLRLTFPTTHFCEKRDRSSPQPDWRWNTIWSALCQQIKLLSVVVRPKAPTTRRKVCITSLVIMTDIQEEPARLLATFVHVNSTKWMSVPTPKQTTIKGKPQKIWYC